MDSFAGSPQDPQSLHKYLYAHNNPVNNIDPSGRFPWIKVVAVVAIIMAALIGIDWLIGGPVYRYRVGLGHPSIKDEDIVVAIKGFRRGTEELDDIIEPLENCPVTFVDLNEKLKERGVVQVGEMLVGVVGVGRERSPGYKRIINYFESFTWNLFHPGARQHGSWMLGGVHPYIPSKAEVKRMNIIIHELELEAKQRGISGY